MKNNILKRSFYAQPTIEIAKQLLGKFLYRRVNGKLYVGKIVETEAYLGAKDSACHASRGMTERNKAMFGPAGHAYVYFIYGMYHCLNVVTEKENDPCAVLIRALEPAKIINHSRTGVYFLECNEFGFRDNLKLKITRGTINFGSPYVRAGLVCNSNGFIVGDMSGGPEIQNVDESLGFIEY